MIRSMTRWALVALAALSTQAAAGEAQLAALDPSFGDQGDGRQVIEFPGGDAIAYAIATDAQSRLLLAGRSRDAQSDFRAVVVRLLASGATDPTFAREFAPLPNGATGMGWNAAASAPDGGVVAVGFFQDNGNPLCPSNTCWFVCKLDAVGHFAPGFGSPKTLGCSAILAEGGLPGQAVAIAVQTDGKILLAGFDYEAQSSRGILLRMTAEGELDPTFGNNGFATLPEQYVLDSAFYALAIAPDGSLAVAGQYGVSGDEHMIAARFNANGQPLQTFGGGAHVVAFTQLPPGERRSAALDIHVGTDGSVLLSGTTDTGQNGQDSQRPALAKLDAAGNGVEAFGMPGLPTGQRIVETCGVPPCHFRSVNTEVQADGRILLSGNVDYSDLGIRKIYAMRLSPLGEIDPSFGSNDSGFAPGVATAWWPDANGFYSSTLQGSKLVLAGGVSENGVDGFAAVRFRDGTLFADGFDGD